MSRAPAGSFVFVPRGAPHCFQGVAEGPTRILVIFNPSGIEGFFDRFAELPAGPVDSAEFQRLGGAVGMNVVGPPLAKSDPL